MNKISYLIAFVGISSAVNCAADELSETGTMLDGIAAIVNEGVVLKSKLNQQVEMITQRAGQQGLQLPPKDVLEAEVLEQLIIEEVQLQRAERVGIQISDQMLNRHWFALPSKTI